MTRSANAMLYPEDGVGTPDSSERTQRDPDTAVRLSRISRHTTGRLRRSTLVFLRWMAVVGQSLTLLIVANFLGFELPILVCFGVIALSALINILVSIRLPLDRRVGDFEAAAQLGFDLLQLSVLLGLTGGMTNPFALLILAPVVTGATTLSRTVLITLGALAAALSFGLLFYSQPLPWRPQGGFDVPFTFSLGTWIALMVGTVFTSLYAWRSASESRRMSEALAATEAVLSHEQKLSALGGMAAAAAHELGTPLATIQVTAKEMARELPHDTPLGEDARLMLSQAQRCRDILQQLARRGDEGDMIHDQLSVEDLLEEAVEPFIDFGPHIDIHIHGDGPAPQIGRQAELLYSLKNLIENAADFARVEVKISAFWTADRITLTIEDDGPGFDPAIRGRLGEPYVTRRGADDDGAGGLGLGVFISKTLIERTGGTVAFETGKGGGARVLLGWPRGQLEATHRAQI